MTPSQRKAAIKVLHFYREAEKYTGCTSVRIHREQVGSSCSLVVRTRRSDCHRHSQRQIHCERYAHMFIGPRGGIEVVTARTGFDDETAHIQRILRMW